MKTKLTIIVGFVLAVAAIFGYRIWCAHDPAVAQIVKQLPKQGVPPARAKLAAPSTSGGHIVSSVPDSVLEDAVAVSSFFAHSEVSNLSNEQLAALEKTLWNATRATYKLLLERGTVTQMPRGNIRIEIPAQGDKLAEMRSYVYESIAEIVGPETMKLLEAYSLGPKFDARFAYFGKYDTTIDLSIEQPSAPGRSGYVTMRNDYDTGKIMSTHVIKLDRFEQEFFSLPGPNSKG